MKRYLYLVAGLVSGIIGMIILFTRYPHETSATTTSLGAIALVIIGIGVILAGDIIYEIRRNSEKEK